jgi:hypothetical protein
MGSYIRSAQENIRNIAVAIHQRTAGKALVRFALVKYRDHPPQDSTFVTEAYPFTDNIELMKQNVDTMAASGGGDGPEAVSAALHEVNLLEWRPNASKVCVLISDAPPHGLGESGDGFPQGCPMGTDPIKTCKEMAAKGIVVYAVGVEPVLSTSYKFARDFMMMVAQVTEGKFLPLGKAEILTDVIVNGALEGLSIKSIWEKLEADVAAEAAKNGETLAKDVLVARVEEQLMAKRTEFQMPQVDVANPYLDDRYDDFNCANMRGATTLAEARSKLDVSRNKHVSAETASYAWSAQPAMCAPSACSTAQVSRMVGHAKKSAK